MGPAPGSRPGRGEARRRMRRRRAWRARRAARSCRARCALLTLPGFELHLRGILRDAVGLLDVHREELAPPGDVAQACRVKRDDVALSLALAHDVKDGALDHELNASCASWTRIARAAAATRATLACIHSHCSRVMSRWPRGPAGRTALPASR